MREIADRAVEEALQVVAACQEWDGVRGRDERLERVQSQLRTRFLYDLLDPKESATEAVVSAAMAAPTADLRDRLVRLADEDRRNGDMLRRLLDVKKVAERRLGDSNGPGAWGAHGGASREGVLVSTRIRDTLDALRARREEPRRIVLSGEAVRHLRDESLVRAPDGTAFDIPVTWTSGGPASASPSSRARA